MSVRAMWKGIPALLAILAVALFASGCEFGGGDDDKKSSKKKAADPKVQQVSENEKAFEKTPDNPAACRNLALSYVALASPTSSGKEGKPVEPPKDRDKNMKKAAETYEKCAELAPKDIDIKRSLASSYMATGDYDKASPLLEQVAKQAKTNPNDFYAWGLAASNAADTKGTIEAWERFLATAPKNDPRNAQVRKSLELLREEEAKK